ncbi:hypothetical protein [Nostoc sp. 'Lobaria pulmonaria (5183) cyanobiont']|uniref:hypothetical protein n=1 Tax=Nostoc sp. 'Lobaria pulmonaria (5183) cyanobiont' TaxID=1618022 RepID=UPI000CF32846|nr:hypothetical protein [Nostoc sp. 'Lobaria pulmonaria (5183) cyanobiont']
MINTNSRKKENRCVGWGGTHVGGFPDLSEVAFERSETQQLQDFEVLGFVPQPNLHSIYQNRYLLENYLERIY